MKASRSSEIKYDLNWYIAQQFFLLIVTTLLFFSGLSAQASRDFAIKAVAHVHGSIMANPPMPILFGAPGRGEFTFRPSYFEASNLANQDVDPKSIDYSGSGLAIAYGKQWTRRLGLFFSLSGHTLSGDFIGPGSDPNNLLDRIFANNVEATFFQMNLALSFSLLRGNSLSMPIFFGPVLSSTRLSQTIVQNDPTNPDDFDMNLDITTSGYMAGIQLGIKIGQAVILNPYYIVTGFLSEGDRCQSYSTTVRTYGDLFDLTDPACQEGADSSTKTVEYDIATSSIGLNLMFPSMGLSVNVYTETGEVPFFDGVELTLIQASLVF